MINDNWGLRLTAVLFFSTIASNLMAEETSIEAEYPDKIMFRLGAYVVGDARTNFTILSDAGIGAGINFEDDLGGDTRDTIPRLDAYYRFNDNHRIEFTAFNVDRDGRKTLTVDLTIGNETYLASETVQSSIDYTLYKIGYAYSFYHSPDVELSLSAGLNITKYDYSFNTVGGGKNEADGVTAPLPVFGLLLDYTIAPRWHLNYRAESFFIEIENSYRGSLLINEVSIDYRIFKNFAIGAGIARQSIDLEIRDDKWDGSMTDSYRGLTAYGTLYF